MIFREGTINLEMIHKVWKQSVSGINTIQIYEKLTDDHIIKNAHNRMLVYLSVQVLSQNVHRILSYYCDGGSQRKED